MTARRAAPKAQRAVTPELVRWALHCIPPDVDRDTWSRIGMAIKSELASDAGFALWDEWSAHGESYDAGAARATWRSIRPGGGVAIGTLFGIAKEHGFRFPDADGQAVQTSEQIAAAEAEAERLAGERRRAQEIESARHRQRADQAARDAADLWADASQTGTSPYLQRKGVQGHGVRYLPDDTLLVPMRDRDGELQNLQRIAPAKPNDGRPEKRFLSGGRKSGLWHWCGEPAGAAVLLLAEGYATAASLHEATGRPVAVAFDAGNLVHVAAELAARFPGAALLVCGDDDRETAQRTGKNPGRDKAASAVRKAKACGAAAAAVFPDGLAESGTDFNDLAACAGADAVRAIVEPACIGLAADLARQAAETGSGVAIDDRDGPPHPAERDAAANADDPFSLSEAGVWFTGRDREGNPKKPQWLCAPLEVTARTRADDTNGWGYLLRFSDPDGNPKTWAMPSALLSGDSGEWAARLRDMGLRMAPGTVPRNMIARYIDTRESAERVTCTAVVGWHGPVFVLPSCTIGTRPDRRTYVFQSDTGMEDTLRHRGTLAQWRAEVAALCVGNSRLLFALCCAFGGPLLHLANAESGVMSLTGKSGAGKTTAMQAATSVYGRPSYMQRWRSTSNALESIAVQHSDLCLVLDEIGQLDPREVGEVAYLLANGMEKGRSTRNGLAKKRRTWRVLVLSSGEVSLPDLMAEGGKRTRAGQEVRFLDIPSDAGGSMGALEALHGHQGPGELAEAVTRAAATFYGTAGRTWLEWLCTHHADVCTRLPDLVERHRSDLVPEAAAAQVRRAGSRFALVATAGELATKAGITGWAKGEAARGVRACFNAWMAARGHLDNGEDAAMLRQVRQFLELHAEGRFTWWHRAADDHAPKTLNRAGFRRLLGDDGKPIKSDADHQREYGERIAANDGERTHFDFIILREVFQREVCKGFNCDEVAKLLQRRGHLVHEVGRLMDRQRLPGMGKAACYHLLPSIFNDEL